MYYIVVAVVVSSGHRFPLEINDLPGPFFLLLLTHRGYRVYGLLITAVVDHNQHVIYI